MLKLLSDYVTKSFEEVQIGTTRNPLDGNRLPDNLKLKLENGFYMQPAIGDGKEWPACAFTEVENPSKFHFVSPRVVLGYGFYDGKPKQLVPCAFAGQSIAEFQKTGKVLISGSATVNMDDYTKKTIVPKKMSTFKIAE